VARFYCPQTVQNIPSTGMIRLPPSVYCRVLSWRGMLWSHRTWCAERKTPVRWYTEISQCFVFKDPLSVCRSATYQAASSIALLPQQLQHIRDQKQRSPSSQMVGSCRKKAWRRASIESFQLEPWTEAGMWTAKLHLEEQNHATTFNIGTSDENT